MKNGVPWDEAWRLEQVEVQAALVVFGEFEGNEFDWRTGRWKERK